jgi:hypothetical protein
MLTTVDSPRSDDEDESPTKRKGKRRGKVAPLPEFDPPTLGEYLLHLFDLNQLRSLKVRLDAFPPFMKDISSKGPKT